MNKKEFLSELGKKLSKLSKREIKERLVFYNESIDDRMEEGLSEEDAVLAMGDIDQIAAQIIEEMIADGETSLKKKLNWWEIVLLSVGAPMWIPLILAGFIMVWSLLVALWVIEIPFLIFEYISKYLFIGCKAASKWVYTLTKHCITQFKLLF